MGKGLSKLQCAILDVLRGFPSLAERRGDYIGDWARPRDILVALKRPPTSSNRVAISKALARLHQRGLVAVAAPELCTQGRGYRYCRITEPAPARR